VGNAEINLSEERLLLGADYDDHDLVFARPDGTPTQPCSMSISLDAFVAGPNESMDNGVGDGGERLHEWTVTDNFGTDLEGGVRSGGVNGQVIDEFMSTGAVVAGRGTFELHVVPVLFGQGRRLFEDLGPEQIGLERTRVLEGEDGVTHMHYRVLH
jgi:hypothetical protein